MIFHSRHLPTDHPRSRGEYHDFLSLNDYNEGSSPLSRGIRPRPACMTSPARIIPALAGNTFYQFLARQQ